jgi:hypothetical protein
MGVMWGCLPQQAVAAQKDITGGVLIHSVLPRKICVGDVITISGGASITNHKDVPPPLAWLPVSRVKIQAALGQVTPTQITQYNDGFYFDFTYRATQPGTETVTLTLNDGLAVTHETFQVEENCDYDAFLTTVMHFSTDFDDEHFESLTHVTGMGTMKRLRDGEIYYQGEGKWHLEEVVLSKPLDCVEFYAPPLMITGWFELDGKLEEELAGVDVILTFLPVEGPIYYGEVVCVDADGNVGTGSGGAQGGDPSLTSHIQALFPAGGGTQQVQLQGEGLELMQSAGSLEYLATLTLIVR